ncbi:hypothetical protein SELMODRAFT_184376 [Selaginella moellendorffii]|uniref:Uncharacterized protein n=1 Tax=Selaginella moellendorffii TaxID=88036 RepID=D8T0Q8_SELML|nr:ankyrin repeat domain-containing protein 39 [Selaginella moellendorffii]EFJ09749.1 hypothetical protein SELMODRAFT_184376 [Selaginella moellendorffii]|eukprot:XP_002989155.1 ankyrin repeat domain-containing protein 39 [Selaginella moellendorffii]
MEEGGGHSCDCCRGTAAVESLEEMEFARSLSGAAHTGDVKRMERLLEKGACVQGGAAAAYSPLHYAARNGHLEACRLLLKFGAGVDARTRSGRATSLHRAAFAGHEDIVALLLESGADRDAVDSDGHTPLHKAMIQNHDRVALLLSDKKKEFLD